MNQYQNERLKNALEIIHSEEHKSTNKLPEPFRNSEGFTCSACVKAQGRWPKEAISNWQQLCWSNSASPWGWGWTTSWIWENRNASVVIHSWFILLVRCTIWTTQQLLLQHSPAWLNSAQAAWLNSADQMADVPQHCTGGKKQVTRLH